MLKKTLSAIALAAAALGAQAADVLKVAATAVPHAEILNFVKPQLKAQGLDLQVKEFSDYVQPNAAVEDKQLDAAIRRQEGLNFAPGTRLRIALHTAITRSFNRTGRDRLPNVMCPLASAGSALPSKAASRAARVILCMETPGMEPANRRQRRLLSRPSGDSARGPATDRENPQPSA